MDSSMVDALNSKPTVTGTISGGLSPGSGDDSGQQEQRRGSTPALSVTTSGHKKLCRVVRGQRVILGSAPPVFVTELRPAISSEFLSPSRSSPKLPSPLSIEVDGSVEAHDSDQCYVSGSDDHSALSRNTSAASETLSQEYSYSPAMTTTTAPSAMHDPFPSGHSPANVTLSQASCDFVCDFSKLSLQDSGYSGSFPLCATNSDASSILSAQTSASSVSMHPQTPTFESIGPEYYANLLEFALKLGYNEAQLKSVLNKLGPASPGQDKVLAELIKLGQDVQETQSTVVASVTGGCGRLMTTVSQQSPLRAIVVDGSNVAMTQGNKVVFSCLGIRLCVDWFRQRGHNDIKVFVPQFRKEQSRSDNPITDQHILFDLEKENILVWTPSRRLGGRRIICHDDRYILKTAVDKDAVIVSNDEYRDMMYENPDFRKAVEERLLMYNFIDGKFIVPDDPLGRYGPKLDQFLSKSSQNSSAPPCPYGRKCTYGNKCKFYHPERLGGLHRSVTERLRDHAELHRRISPTNSLQSGRYGVVDNAGDGYSFGRSNRGPHKQGAFRTQSLNPASLLRQHSNSNSTPPGGHSPPSLTPPYFRHPSQPPVDVSLGDDRKYIHYGRLQRLQADGEHSSLSKQMSNPEAARHYGAVSPAEDSRYLMPPSMGPPDSLLRQIWHSQQQAANQQHGVYETLHPHQPVVRNMSAPGVNVLRHRTHLQFPPVANDQLFVSNCYASDYQRKNSVSDSQLNFVGAGPAVTPCGDNDDAFYPLSSPCNYYIPSTTVWGPVEHSSSPVYTSPAAGGWAYSSTPPLHPMSAEDASPPPAELARSKVYYHLAQLFPEELVSSVMRSNPNEMDPQKLCSLILTAREQKGPSEKAGGASPNCGR